MLCLKLKLKLKQMIETKVEIGYFLNVYATDLYHLYVGHIQVFQRFSLRLYWLYGVSGYDGTLMY